MLRLNFFKVKFQPNQLVENLTSYLSKNSVEHIVVNTQIITTKDYISNNKTLTLRLETNGGTLDEINYASIAEDDLGVLRYYFISNKVQVSEFIYDITFALDVVNTYQDEITTQKNFRNVKVLRRHKNRFTYNKSLGKYFRVYDRADEGLGDLTQDVSSTKDITTTESYIVTKGYEDLNTDTSKDSSYILGSLPLKQCVYCNQYTSQSVNTISIDNTWFYLNNTGVYNAAFFVMPRLDLDNANTLISASINVSGVGGRRVIGNAIFVNCTFESNGCAVHIYVGNMDLNTTKFYVLNKFDFNKYEDADVYLNDVTATGAIEVDYGLCKSTPKKYSVGDEIDYASIINVEKTIKSTRSSSTRNIKPVSMVNTTDSNIKQIQSTPLLPSNMIYFNGEILVYEDVSMSSYQVEINDNYLASLPTNSIQLRSQQYESKLFGSYVTKRQVVYDTFALPVLPEYYESNLSSLNIEVYKPNDMSSDLAMCCESQKCHNFNDNTITCSRNSELPIYTSEYLSYVRNGYNYDSKMQTLSKVKTAIGVGTGMFGSGLNAGLSYQAAKQSAKVGLGTTFFGQALGGAVSTAGSLVNTIITETANDMALDQKRHSMLIATPTMSGSNSIELFKELNGGNVVKYVVSKPREAVMNSIWNLFYFYGYVDNQTYDTMVNTKSRKYFDYIQANVGACTIEDPVVRQYCTDAYAQGIMFCHQFNTTYLFDGYTLYENWETSINAA